ncbi:MULTISPECIES: class I SAM-dependent methyltransferase [unclassified Aureimonas]|uniref:class I SAM-dependent methyltransferase n=1 Tax=unclassified Aureimonas TaxID=2615206 RepID=UPI000A570EAA|nr:MULTISPECIES: class I SAM-dependent methyltransferase [unclassified Aureimonas]
MSEQQTEMLSKVAAYYAGRLAEHGATPQGVDWNGQVGQDLRHQQFLRMIEDPSASVVDLGCGFGDFLRFLRDRGHSGDFIGYDVASEMIERAHQLYGEGADRRWVVGTTPEPGSVDYAVASGIFNVRGDVSLNTWDKYFQNTIMALSRTARRGFAFNVLSLSSDPERRRSNLYYADPVQTLSWCLSQFGRRVALLQDYGLYEFTMIIRQGTDR